MARIELVDGGVALRLHPIEQAASLRRSLRIPLDAIATVAVVDRPWNNVLPRSVTFGLSTGAPTGALLVTAATATAHGGTALVFVYRNGRSIVLRLRPTDDPGLPRLVVVSSRAADDIATRIRAAMPAA